MQNISESPPKAPPIKYTAPLGTRWAKEKAAAGGAATFDLPTDPKTIGPWIMGECVGKGASGRVKIAKHRRTGQLAAVKILPIAPLVSSRASLATQQAKFDKQRLGIDREITMMKLMNHPNIMRIYDVYEGDKELFLVLEYVEGGELFDFLVNRGRLPANEALIYFRQIVYGLNYAHTFSIIHRDLKPENILIASLSPPQLKIADWGMAAFAPPTLQLETSCGSPHYASPEIVNGEKYQGNATDIWSCGVILYALLTGRLPFDDKNVRSLLSKVKSGKYEMPSWIDPLAKDLLSKMLIVDVKQRITIPEILAHPWLTTQPNISFSASDGATFTLLAPPLPPSPSILGRPILSPDLIDSELLSSLRIIWGRHSDPQGESIKRDLCAPAGKGVHAKAFYFLLGRYREDAYRSRTKDAQDHASSMQRTLASACSTIDLETLKFNLGWELDQSCGLKKYEVPKTHRALSAPQAVLSSASVSASPPSYPSSSISAGLPPGVPSSRKRTLTEGHLSAAVKDRPDSPAGPRPPPGPAAGKTDAVAWKPWVQGHQSATAAASPTIARPQSSVVGAERGGPRSLPPRRGYTHSSTMERRENINPTGGAIGFSAHLQQLQARSMSVSAASSSSSSARPKSSVGPGSAGGHNAFSDAEKRAMFIGAHSPTSPQPSTHAYGPAQPQGQVAPRVPLSPIASPEMMSVGSLELPILTAPRMANAQLQRKVNDIAQKVNDLVQAVTQAPSQPSSGASSTPSNATADRESRDTAKLAAPSAVAAPNLRADAGEDKENQSVDDESWSHVSADADRSGGVGLGVGIGVPLLERDVGKDLANAANVANVGNSGSAQPAAATLSPSKARKDKEKKGRPPPLELPSLHPTRRATFAMLGSPIALASPINHPPSSANRILASPVVGEFKGWFSNLFNWKQSHAHGGVLYSGDDIHRTRADVARLLEGLGITVNSSDASGDHNADQAVSAAEVLCCRIEQTLVDQATGASLKNVRFRVEFRAGPGPSSANYDPSAPSLMTPSTDEAPYFLAAPAPAANHLAVVTPTTASSPSSSSSARPRASMLLGRTASQSSSTSTPSTAVLGKWEFPPGCLCAIALVHEKGSMSTFRAVWRRLKEEYGDASTAYPCFSPPIPNTPYAESQRMVI